MKLWWLGCSAIRRLELSHIAQPHLQGLALSTRELVNTAVLDGKEVVYIEKLDSLQSVRAHIPIGGRAPAHCVATGKAIMAYLDEAELSKILAGMKKFTDRTIVGIEPMKKHLEQVRKRGYSINAGEYHADVGGLAAPIRDAAGRVIAAIGVTAPINRLTRATIPRIAQLTIRAGEAISYGLGFNPQGFPGKQSISS
jgi:DNA-binding IclR family transcriptional regulator